MTTETLARPAALSAGRHAPSVTGWVARTTSWLATGVAVICALGFLAVAVGPRFAPYRTVTELSGSMSPQIRTGDLVVDVAEPAAAVRPGQVLSFKAPTAGHPVTTHRVISVERRDGKTLIRTRGDANPNADPWLARVDDDTVWRVRAVVPVLGAVIRALRSPAAHATLLYVAPAGLLCWLLVGIWRRPVTAD